MVSNTLVVEEPAGKLGGESRLRKTALLACFADIGGIGGGAVRGQNTAAGLAARGHRMSLLSLRQGAAEPEITQGVPVKYFSLDAGRAWRVPQLVRRRQLGEVLAREAKPPEVFLAISPFFIPPARKLWPNTRIVYLFPCLLWRCVPKAWERRPGWPLRLNHWLVGREERAALGAADAVIIQSQSVAEDVLDFHPPARSRLVVAPTGVRDLASEVRQPREQVRKLLTTPRDAIVAVAVGRLTANKNFSLLVAAMHRLNDPKLWLWIVGDGPLGERLRSEAEAGPAAGRIRFLGVRGDMPDVYAASDLLVHAAWYDNFPNVYLEAMVSGLAVLGPQGEFPRVVSPLGDMIQEGTQGATYRLGDPQELAGRLAELVKHPERIEAMGKAARELAIERFNWKQYLDAVERVMLEC